MGLGRDVLGETCVARILTAELGEKQRDHPLPATRPERVDPFVDRVDPSLVNLLST